MTLTRTLRARRGPVWARAFAGCFVVSSLLCFGCGEEERPDVFTPEDAGSDGDGSGGADAGSGGSSAGGSSTGGTVSTGGAIWVADGGAPACDETACRLAWPLRGALADDFVVAYYVDHGSVTDYRGGPRTYAGHTGVDISLANFRFMDEGVTVYAAAPGVVEHVQDGLTDRNMTMNPPGGCDTANRVYVRHPNGDLARYLHFKKDSIRVNQGDAIEAGTPLGSVGSSGCSEGPHLHFEIFDEGGTLIDPFEAELWESAPPYDFSLQLMDHVVRSGAITTMSEIWDPGANVTSLSSGSIVGFAVITGGATAGDRVDVDFFDGADRIQQSVSRDYDGTETLYGQSWNVELSGTAGTWTAEIHVNDEPVRAVEFVVE